MEDINELERLKKVRDEKYQEYLQSVKEYEELQGREYANVYVGKYVHDKETDTYMHIKKVYKGRKFVRFTADMLTICDEEGHYEIYYYSNGSTEEYSINGFNPDTCMHQDLEIIDKDKYNDALKIAMKCLSEEMK